MGLDGFAYAAGFSSKHLNNSAKRKTPRKKRSLLDRLSTLNKIAQMNRFAIRQHIRQRAFYGVILHLQNCWFSSVSLTVIPLTSATFRYCYSFKFCFPHQTKTLEKSRVFAILGPPKTGFECNYECNWSCLTPILAAIGWDYFFIFKKYFFLSDILHNLPNARPELSLVVKLSGSIPELSHQHLSNDKSF